MPTSRCYSYGTMVALALLVFAVACGSDRSGLIYYADAARLGPSMDARGSGGAIADVRGAGGVAGRDARAGGQPPSGGEGGIVFRIPDGGFGFRIPDGGVNLDALGGILDALGSSPLGRLICGGEVRTGAACTPSGDGVDACVLPNLAGVCTCLQLVGTGFWSCPARSSSGPPACPVDAQTGSVCSSPLSTCFRSDGTGGCFCGSRTYTCL